MPSDADVKKNSLQDVVDSIQTQVASPIKGEPVKGYVPNPELKSLRTFQGDVQEHIDVKKETIATIAIAEQKKKIENNEPTYTERRKSSSHGGVFVIIGIICFILGGAIFGGLYFLNSQKEEQLTAEMEKTIIPYTHKRELTVQTLNKDNVASVLLVEQSTFKAPVNSVLYTPLLYGTSSVSATNLARIIATNAGDSLKRNITDGMAGVYSFDTNEIFFILQVDDFGIAYSSMLDWESTMGGDVSIFFPPLNQHLSTNPSVFTDETYKNKDVRVIRNEYSSTVLLYGFIDKNTLVITANEKIFEAILNKYNQSKLAR